MAKICVNCDKKIGLFSNDPFEFNNVVLCYDCAKPISNALNALYYAKSEDEFLKLREEILKTSQTLYSPEVVTSVNEKIKIIYDGVKESLEVDIAEEPFEPIINKKDTEKTHSSAQNYSRENHSSDGLYENIGEKIKGLAKWTFIVEAIGAIITGLVLLFTDEDLILYGLLTLICGPIIAYVGSWILYAFGELVDKTSENEKNTRNILALMKESTKE